jgi:CAAX prenyl protease-like protein
MPVVVKKAPLDYHTPPSARSSGWGDDLAYLVPMGTFLLFTQAGVTWRHLYPLTYVAKTVVVAVLLVLFRRRYTPVRWNFWWLGVALGVIGIVQWLGMQLWLQRHVAFFHPPDAKDVFDPFRDIASPGLRWAFVGVRLAGATLLVPVMEELFWRDYLWRRIVSPNDFKLAAVGEWDVKAFLLVPLFFAVVHGNWWLTAIAWGFMIGGLLAWARSLGACIVMHATTNLLLGLYVLRYRDWAFW